MISSATAALALSVAKNVIKFGGRLDRLLAEKVAVRSGLVLTLPTVDFSPGPNVVLPKLQAYLAATSVDAPGPIGADERAALATLIPAGYVFNSADLANLRRFYALAYPEVAADSGVIVPDASFLAYLREAMPGARDSLPASASDTDAAKQAAYQTALLVSAFSVDPGADQRQLGYPVRIGLLVVDTLAEFGAENTALFVRDERLRAVVQAVLQRFAKPDLESFDAWSPLLRHALSSTLNGVLDSREAWQGDDVWIGAALGALADARDAAGDQGDDYLLGLLQGRGYRLLVSKGLTRAAGVLGAETAPAYQQVIADVLKAAAPLVANDQGGFGAFFSQHWTDLAQAALTSVQRHGPALLSGQTPVVRDVLLAMINTLASDPVRANLLSGDTLLALANAAIGAVAQHPEIWGSKGWPGLNDLISSALRIVSDQGIQNTFTTAGVTAILQGAAATLAQHPEWLVQKPGLLQAIVGGVLKELSVLDTLSAKTIANALVSGALTTIGARPDLLNGDYAAVLASFAAFLAARVKESSLTSLQAADIADAAAKAVLAHPTLFADAQAQLATRITNAVLRAAKGDSAKLLVGTTLVAVIPQLFAAFGRNGAAAAAPGAVGQLEDKLTAVLAGALAAAKDQLGQNLDLPSLPTALAAIVAAWARGDTAALDPNNQAFKDLFAQIAARSTPTGLLPA